MSTGTIVRGELAQPAPVLVAEADIVAERYTLGGAPSTFAGLFSDVRDWPHELGVGLVKEKLAGVNESQVNYTNGIAFLSQALFDLINVEGGCTILWDFEISNIVQFGVSHPTSSMGIEYTVDFDTNAFNLWKASYGRWTTENVPFPGDTSVFDYDYDAVPPIVDSIETWPATQDIRQSGQWFSTFAPAMQTWFGDRPEVAITLETGIPYPDPRAQQMYIALRASAHHNQNGDNIPVSIRNVIKRLRFYTPGQSPGWHPSKTGLWPIDELDG